MDLAKIQNRVAAGALMVLVMAAAIAMIPPMMFPVLKEHSEAARPRLRRRPDHRGGAAASRRHRSAHAAVDGLAQSQAGTADDPELFKTVRVLDADIRHLGTPVSVVFFCLSVLLLNYLLFRSRLVPRLISGWALVAVVPYVADGVLVMFGLLTRPRRPTVADSAIGPQRNGLGAVAARQGIPPERRRHAEPVDEDPRWPRGRAVRRLAAMQMVERPWGVVVYGAASVKAKPDLVRIRFKVIRLEQSPSESFQAASETVGEVRRALREHGVGDAAVERSRLGLKSAWEFGDERRFLGYECQASFAVESTNLDGVQALLIALVAAGANEIEAVDFDVRAKPDLRAEARRQAVAAARRKAELYAEAAGVRVGAVLHIDDIDSDNPDHRVYRGHGSYSGEASAEDLAPGHVVVNAAVILGLSISRD